MDLARLCLRLGRHSCCLRRRQCPHGWKYHVRNDFVIVSAYVCHNFKGDSGHLQY